MPNDSTPKIPLSSFEKGIKKRLSREKQAIEWIIGKYIVGVNSKWNSDNFPSTQLAKVVLNVTGQPKREFSSMHRLIREILMNWEKEEICKYVTTTKYAHCRKTKMVYYFPPEGLKKIKEMLIDQHLDLIKNWDLLKNERFIDNEDVMKTRENIIRFLSFEILNFKNRIEDTISKFSN
jgi:hypothetical protein